MALRDRNLIDDERVVLELRSHAKALIWPFLLFLVLAAGAVVTFLVSDEDLVTWVVLGVLAVVALVWVFLPWLRWRTSSYTVTTQRIAHRSGIITRIGRDIPCTASTTSRSRRT
ncbi:PH domain-containing protein [Xylanimonas allomyrinae]|uniref:PH domain-containing protein n=1 Tax=Xylanimonas allomyrinae TaxID=2509459 RepID=UPI001FE264F6|nr:PH domain-containing protein [Xylanimonas allomyrinae]